MTAGSTAGSEPDSQDGPDAPGDADAPIGPAGPVGPVDGVDAVDAVDLHGGGADGELARLYARRHDDMVRLAYVLTGSAEVAADVTQDSFVKLFRKWDTVRDAEAYLRRVVVNGCRSAHRRGRRERDHVRSQAGIEQPVDLEADELFDALAGLPHRQRAAIVLRYYDGRSEAEIADVLGCRPGTVGSLLHRGLAQLREVIER